MGCNLIAECEGSGITATIYVKGKSPCPYCRKTHIDLRRTVEWKSQRHFDTEHERDTGCLKACKLILESVGLVPSFSDAYKVTKEVPNGSGTDGGYLDIDKKKAEEGVDYIDQQLELSRPVVVGVDYKNNNKDNDHFVVIIGRDCNNNKTFYYFYEVGTEHKNKGESKDNKLEIKDYNTLRGTPIYDTSRKYIVSLVMRNNLQ